MDIEEIIRKIIIDSGITTDVNRSTKLYGGNGSMDSLDLVGLVIAIEEKLGISITSDKAFSEKKSPFSTFGKLVDFVKDIEDSK